MIEFIAVAKSVRDLYDILNLENIHLYNILYVSPFIRS